MWFPEDPARKALIQRCAIAFVWCAMDHVREDCDLEPHLQVRALPCNKRLSALHLLAALLSAAPDGAEAFKGVSRACSRQEEYHALRT